MNSLITHSLGAAVRLPILACAVLASTLIALESVRPPLAAAQVGWQPPDSLDVRLASTLAAGTPSIAIAGDRSILAAWCYQQQIPGEIYTARFSPGTGWTPRTPFDMHDLADRVFSVEVAVNATGLGWMAWNGQSGIYVAPFDPATGWGAPITIRSGPNGFLGFAENIGLGIDASGIGLLVWTNPNRDSMFYSRSTAGGAWTAPQSFMNSTSSVGSLEFDSNAAGQAAVVWERYTPTGPWTIWATQYEPGAGWQAPTSLFTSATYHQPQVAINDSGSFVATWVDFDTSFPTFHVDQRRFTAGQGWTAAESPGLGRSVAVELGANGDEVLMWESLGDFRVVARRWLSGTGWQAEENLQSGFSGDPSSLQVKLDPLGDGLAVWQTPHVPGTIEARRLDRSLGWEPILVLGVGNPRLGFEGAAAAVAFTQSYTEFDGQFFHDYDNLFVIRTNSTTVPVLVSLVDAEVSGDGVRVRWLSGGTPIAEATVYRRVVDGPWIAIGSVRPDGTGMMVFQDAGAVEGGRYGYRLGISENGAERFFGEAWVEVPRTALAIASVRPNPVRRSRFSVTFLLPESTPARIELLDLAGRRRLAKVVVLGPGRHDLVVDGASDLEPGLYFLRLSQGARASVRRVAVAR